MLPWRCCSGPERFITLAAQKGCWHRHSVSVVQLTEAVKFLASKVPEPPDLRRQPLVDVVEDTLTQHFFTPVLQDLKLRQQRGKLHQVGLSVAMSVLCGVCLFCIRLCGLCLLCMSMC